MICKKCCAFLSLSFLFVFTNAVYAVSLSASQLRIQTLRSVILRTLQNNPEVLQTIANKNASHANYRSAVSGFLPKVFLRYDTGKEKKESTSRSIKEITLNRRDQAVGVSQSIFQGFSTYNLVKERRAEYRASRLNINVLKETVANRTTQSYMEVLRLQRLYKLALKNIRQHGIILAKVRAKYRAGAGRKTELNLAQGRLTKRLASLHGIIGSKQQAAANFKQLTGFYPHKLIEPKSQNLPAKLPANLTRAQLIATKINPILLAAKTSLQAATSAVAASKGALLPKVDLELSKGRYENDDGIRGVDHDAQAMVMVSYNLFNGGADVAAVDNAKAKRYAAFEHYVETKRAVETDVANAWYILQADRQQLKQNKRYARSVEKVLSGYKKQFALGRRSLLNLLDMQNEVFIAEANVINETYSVQYDKYNLLASIGNLVDYFTG